MRTENAPRGGGGYACLEVVMWLVDVCVFPAGFKRPRFSRKLENYEATSTTAAHLQQSETNQGAPVPLCVAPMKIRSRAIAQHVREWQIPCAVLSQNHPCSTHEGFRGGYSHRRLPWLLGPSVTHPVVAEAPLQYSTLHDQSCDRSRSTHLAPVRILLRLPLLNCCLQSFESTR